MYRDTGPVESERSYEASATAPPAAAETESMSQLSDELLMAEALSVDSIMTAARLHREEAENLMHPQIPHKEAMAAAAEAQGRLHDMQYQAQVSKLGALGIAESDIPKKSLKDVIPKDEGKDRTYALAA